MDLDGLDAFFAVVQHGSFTAAARSLGVEPSATSRRVAKLEADLGVALLYRTTRQVRLTEAGRELLDQGGPALQRLREAAEEIRAADAALRGLIRLSVPGAFGRRRIAPLLFSFLERNPEVSLDLRVSDARLDLLAEGIDLALRVGVPREPNFTRRLLGTSPQAFFASEQMFCGAAPPDSVEALAQHRLVLRREGGQVLAPPGLAAAPLTCDDVETVARAVCAGLGVGLLPVWLAEELPGLVRLPIQSPIPPAQIFAVLPGGRRPPRRVRALLDWLVLESTP